MPGLGQPGPRLTGTLEIARTWDGAAIADDERVTVGLILSDRFLEVDFTAPHHGDPLPDGPVGTTEGLWEYEVVELFLLGDHAHYIELEFGPGGHSLALRLHGPRTRVEPAPALAAYAASLVDGRWRGVARVARDELPAGLRACNAYAIHGQGSGRRFLAAGPVIGAAPDFHRLECFLPLPWKTVNHCL